MNPSAWQWTPYAALLIGVSVLLIGLTLYIWQRFRGSRMRIAALVTAAITVWTISYTLRLSATGLTTKVFWLKIQYLGVVSAPIAWFCYILFYSGREKWLTRRNMILLGIAPLITLALAFTNQAHGLIWSALTLDTSRSPLVLAHHFGWGLWLYAAYAYGLLLSGLVFLLQSLFRSRLLYRRQTFMLLLGALAPWVGSSLDLAHQTRVEIVPLAFVVTGLSLAWSLLHLRLGEIMPVAHQAIIEGIQDAVLVLDAQGRILELNPAAEGLIGLRARQAVGQFLTQLLPEWPIDMKHDDTAVGVRRELAFNRGPQQPTYDVRISPLTDWRGQLLSQVIVLRDISERKLAEQRLQESERQFRDLFEGLPVACWAFDRDGKILHWNLACEALYGWSARQAIGQTMYDLMVQKRNVAETQQTIAAVFRGQSFHGLEYQDRRADGNTCDVLVSEYPLRDASGHILMGICAQVDITARKRAERESHRRAEMLAALHETALDLSAQPSLDDLLRAIVDRAVGLLEARDGGIYLYRPATDDLQLAISHDPASTFIGEVLQRGQGLSGKVLETGQTQVVDDYGTWAGRTSQHDGGHFAACAALPIVWGQRLHGVLSMVYAPPLTFTPEDIALLERFTPLAAAALEQTRLLEETRSRMHEAETLRQASAAVVETLSLEETLERILEQLARVVPFDSASIQLLRQGCMEIVSGRGFVDATTIVGLRFPITDKSVTQTVVNERRPLILDDARTAYAAFRQPPHQRIRSWMGVPLAIRDQVIGMLTIDGEQSGQFNQEHLRLVMPFANQAAVAIENAQLYQQEQVRRQIAATLQEVAQIIGSTLELKEVLRLILDQLAKVLDFHTAALLLIDRQRDELYIQEWRGYPEDSEKFCLPLNSEKGITAHVARTGQPIYVADTTFDARYLDGGLIGRSELAVPLTVKGQLIGVLNAESQQVDAYTPEDLSLLTAFASQAAIAIENARLYQESRRQVQELTSLYETALELGGALDIDLLLQRLYAQVQKLLQSDAFAVILHDPTSDDFVVALAVEKDSVVPGAAGIRVSLASPGLTPWVMRHRQPLLIRDMERDPLPTAPHHISQPPARSWLGVPLVAHDRLWGAISVQSFQPGAFSPDDHRFLEALAAQTAIAIENAHLYQTVQRHAEELQWRVEERTAELRAEQEKSEAVLSSVGDAIGMAGLDMRIRYVNQAFTALTGYTAEEAIGRMGNFLVAERLPEPEWQALQMAMARGQSWKGEATLRRKDGRTYQASVTITPMFADGKLTGFVSSHEDISRIKELENARRRFMANVSHELRTPVANLRLYAQLLRMGRRPEKTGHYIEVVEDQTIRLTNLIQDILEMTSIDSGQVLATWQPVRFSSLLNDIATRFSSVAQKTGLTLTVQPLPPELPPVNGDQARLSQALAQVVENALTFTPAGGQVTLTVEPRLDGGLAWVTLTVQDTGPGISDEDLPRLFERFYRGSLAESGHVPGTGLGLSIADEILRAHGGHISVASQEGQGSTFTLWLRQAAPPFDGSPE